MIYKILSVLEKAMDLSEFNMDLISPEVLGVSQERRDKILRELKDCGYIKGVQIVRYVTGGYKLVPDDIQITLKGLEYLSDNSVMKKIENVMKGIKDSVPRL